MLRTFSGRAASQDELELTAFIAFMQERKVSRYLEIGARHGDTFYHVMTALGTGATGVAVDLPNGLWGTRRSHEALKRVLSHLRRVGYRSRSIIGDSSTPNVVAQCRMLGPYDVVFIDGDHRYEAVMSDYRQYMDFATYLAFHDIAGVGQADKVGTPVEVPRAWAELKELHPSWEFITVGSTMGIGILQVKEV